MKSGNGIYFVNLDGLRFIAAAVVLICHFTLEFATANPNIANQLLETLTLNGAGGTVAVRFFFVLSGFLITYLLLNEGAQNGRLNILNFYVRRILRIWPLYYLVIGIGFVLHPMLAASLSDGIIVSSDPIMYVLFLANFDQIYFHAADAPVLGVLWSLSVEEQFYLIWPVILQVLMIKVKRLIPIVFMILIASSLAFISITENIEVVRIHTFSSFFELGVGALLAWTVFNSRAFIEKIYSMLGNVCRFTPILYLSGFLLIYWLAGLGLEEDSYIIFKMVCVIYFAFLILDQIFNQHCKIQFGRPGWLGKLGKISYGIYMFHMIPITLLKFILGSDAQISPVIFILWLTVCLLVTILLSYLSYRYFESIFLAMRKKG